MTLEIKNLSAERDNFDVLLTEKDVEIEKITEELVLVKAELLECKKNSNFIPPDCGKLYLENKELKEKIKESELDHYAYTQQMIEALELLKAQLFKEKNQNVDLKNIIEASNEKNEGEELEIEKTRARELQEELSIAKKQLELMRGSKNEAAFEPFATDYIDDPASTPCKCLIY